MRAIVFLILSIGGSAFIIFWSASHSTASIASMPDRTQPTTSSGAETIKLLFVGDIMPSRWVDRAMEMHGYEFPFERIRPLLRTADIVFGNLESPVRHGRNVQGGEMRFRTDPEFVPHLREAGFDIVSLANNHIGDEGAVGIASTTEYLSRSNILWVGVGTTSRAYAPVLISHSGLKVAFVAGNDPAIVHPTYCANDIRTGSSCFDKELIAYHIQEARSQADFVVFSMHAGDEYTDTPNPLQKEIARLAVDSGADIVIGHHPHTIQSRELYHGKWIYYSLGNFIFDQEWSRNTKLGLALLIEVEKKNAHVLRMTHNIVRVDEYAQPRLATEEETADMFEFLELP